MITLWRDLTAINGIYDNVVLEKKKAAFVGKGRKVEG